MKAASCIRPSIQLNFVHCRTQEAITMIENISPLQSFLYCANTGNSVPKAAVVNKAFA